MRKICGLTAILAALVILPSWTIAQQPIRWEVSLENAKIAASQGNRLILAQFTASWCGACRIMENEVFSQPGVVAAIEAHYVPVKINVEYFPATGRQYGITALPTTVILAPTGQVEALYAMRGVVKADEYIARLNQVAASVKGRGQAVLAQIPATPPVVAAPSAPPPRQDYGRGPGLQPAPMTGPIGQIAGAEGRPPTAPLDQAIPVHGQAAPSPPPRVDNTPPNTNAQPPLVARRSSGPLASAPAAATLPPSQSPLGLDGFCPVRLTEAKAWSRGDRRWGARHRGCTYLFAGPEEQRRFLADPDRYAPVNSGEDIVLAVEQNRSVPGTRTQGVTYGGRMYLFAEEGTRLSFSRNPRFYAERAMQALHAQSQPGQQVR